MNHLQDFVAYVYIPVGTYYACEIAKDCVKDRKLTLLAAVFFGMYGGLMAQSLERLL